MVVKVYFKRDQTSLDRYRDQLTEMSDRLQHPNVLPYRQFFETEKAAYLIRQYMAKSLSERPFLSSIEKKWIAFQLLCALEQCHNAGVVHGDLKNENVLLTTWNWAMIADVAPFKPTFLPSDNPADFSFFFDAGERRRCYLAPERFYDPARPPDDVGGAVESAMDIFSLGCVIAELFLDGKPIFGLSFGHNFFGHNYIGP